MATSGVPVRSQTAQLLVLLYQYVQAHTATHPALLQAVLTLREAAGLYGRDEVPQAFDKGLATFRQIEQARAGSPDLPVP
jgi:hypothetical protein